MTLCRCGHHLAAHDRLTWQDPGLPCSECACHDWRRWAGCNIEGRHLWIYDGLELTMGPDIRGFRLRCAACPTVDTVVIHGNQITRSYPQ